MKVLPLVLPSVRDTAKMLKTLFQPRADPNTRLIINDDTLPIAGRSGYDIHNRWR